MYPLICSRHLELLLYVQLKRKSCLTSCVYLVCVLQVYIQVNREAERNEDIWEAARDFFRQLEQHEGQPLSLWQQFRDITITEYQQVYKVQAHLLLIHQADFFFFFFAFVMRAKFKTQWNQIFGGWVYLLHKKNWSRKHFKLFTLRNIISYLMFMLYLYLSAVRGPLWRLLRRVLSPRTSTAGGTAATEPRPAENHWVCHVIAFGQRLSKHFSACQMSAAYLFYSV